MDSTEIVQLQLRMVKSSWNTLVPESIPRLNKTELFCSSLLGIIMMSCFVGFAGAEPPDDARGIQSQQVFEGH